VHEICDLLVIEGSNRICLGGESGSGPLFAGVSKLCEKFDVQEAQKLFTYRNVCGGQPISATEVPKALEATVSFVCQLMNGGKKGYTCIETETTGVLGAYQDGGIVYEKTDRGWRITVIDRSCVAHIIECMKWMRDFGYATSAYEVDNMKPAASIGALQAAFPDKVHDKDPWGNEFQFELSEQHQRMVSLGPDGKPNSGDEIVFEDGWFREMLK
jgi:hypothetical protein